MKCPECQGRKFIHIPAEPGIHQRYDIICPTCDGAGELPDPSEFPDRCPACGEPVRAGQGWCDVHRGAADIDEGLF